jgi:hypothetical protein
VLSVYKRHFGKKRKVCKKPAAAKAKGTKKVVKKSTKKAVKKRAKVVPTTGGSGDDPSDKSPEDFPDIPEGTSFKTMRKRVHSKAYHTERKRLLRRGFGMDDAKEFAQNVAREVVARWTAYHVE